MSCDESWIYCYDPETKRQSFHWKHAGSPRSKKARQSKSNHRLLRIFFFFLTALAWSTYTGFLLDSQEGILCWGFKGVRKRPAIFKSAQWHFHLDNAPVHNTILVTDYLTKMGIKIVPQPPYSPDLAPCDFCLFPKLRSCRYETTEQMKEAVMKVIETLTQEDFHGDFQKLLERCNKCIAAEEDYFEGD